MHVLSNFVRAVNINIHAIDIVEIEYLDIMLTQALRCRFRARDSTIDLMFDFSKFVNEIVRGRASTDANNAVLDVFDCRLGYLLFQFVLCRHLLLSFCFLYNSNLKPTRNNTLQPNY